MCKKAYLLISALMIVGHAESVFGEKSESIDPLKIPWPNCGVSSNTGFPCEAHTKDIKREATWIVDEITHEDLDEFPEPKEIEKPLKDTAPDQNLKQSD